MIVNSLVPNPTDKIKILAKTLDSHETACYINPSLVKDIQITIQHPQTPTKAEFKPIQFEDFDDSDDEDEEMPPNKRRKIDEDEEEEVKPKGEDETMEEGIPYRKVKSRSGSEWYPNILDNGRLTAFIPGTPGAGKSYLAAELIKLLPSDYDILLFTALEEDDGNFKQFGKRVHKIKMTPENLSRMSLANIRKVSKHPILLFDDIDKIRNREVEKWTFKVLEDALANGRGHKKHNGEGDIHTIVTSHALNDYRKTKYTLENSDYVAIFPGSTTRAQMDRLFDKIGLSKEMCERIYRAGKTCSVRRVIIHKVSPMYIIIGDTLSLI